MTLSIHGTCTHFLRPCILVIATGGTIDKAYPRVTGGWGFEIGDPAAGRILDRIFPAGFSFEVQSVCAKDSQEISDTDRSQILKACEEWPGDQIIITHGTDTLVETACYLGHRAGLCLKSGHQANLSDRRNASRKIRGHGCSLQHGCLLRRLGHGFTWYIRVHEWAGSGMDISTA
ncbi:LOC106176956 [Symbiodinium sp. CCMP2592]|nr:LOC106176956 [Symbiodinium sp. CCMP2592]